MTDVITFPTRNHDPDAAIIATLEDMLADARRGEILSLVAVTSRRSESTGIAISCDSTEAAIRLVGALELAKARLVGMVSDEGVEDE